RTATSCPGETLFGSVSPGDDFARDMFAETAGVGGVDADEEPDAHDGGAEEPRAGDDRVGADVAGLRRSAERVREGGTDAVAVGGRGGPEARVATGELGGGVHEQTPAHARTE